MKTTAEKQFSEMVTAYLESPDWRRLQAAQAAEALKTWKAGRARLLDLVEKAKVDGYLIETETVPLKEGHDSVLVQIEGGGTGFPSFLPAELVEKAFADLLKHAAVRRAHRITLR